MNAILFLKGSSVIELSFLFEIAFCLQILFTFIRNVFTKKKKKALRPTINLGVVGEGD